MIEIRREDLTSETAQALISALNAELRMRYPGDGVHYFRLDPDEVRPGRGAFLVAYEADKPVGCGAVRVIETRHRRDQADVRAAGPARSWNRAARAQCP